MPFKQTKDGELFFTDDVEFTLTDIVDQKKFPINMGHPFVRGNLRYQLVFGSFGLSTNQTCFFVVGIVIGTVVVCKQPSWAHG